MNGRWPSNFCLIHSPGCERVGVKGTGVNRPYDSQQKFGKHGVYGEGNNGQVFGYADPDGLETVDNWICTENCPVAKLGRQSGISKSTRSMRGNLVDNRGDNYGRAEGKRIPDSNYMRGHNDKGTVARFFMQADWSYERVEQEELWKEVM